MQTETNQSSVEERLSQIRTINNELTQVDESLSLLEHVNANRHSFTALIFDRIKGPVVIKDVPQDATKALCEYLTRHFQFVKAQLIAQASELMK